VGSLAAVASAQAQIVWTVDRKASLAWWQVNPHFNQLWATTCPEETSWRPGEGRSSGWNINPALRRPKTGNAGVSDTVHVPFYPRDTVRSVCSEAVEGRVLLPDTVTWRGVRGQVTVSADSLVTGETMRDVYARKAMLHTALYPYIRFTIDSVVDVTRQADTLRATAVGVLSLLGVDKPLSAAVRAWPEAGGTRVLAKLRMPASLLWGEFGISKTALMGVGTRIWKDFFMGVDVLMRAEARGAT
jgi:hypothetical protein